MLIPTGIAGPQRMGSPCLWFLFCFVQGTHTSFVGGGGSCPHVGSGTPERYPNMDSMVGAVTPGGRGGGVRLASHGYPRGCLCCLGNDSDIVRPVPSVWHYCPGLQPQLAWGQILPLAAQSLPLSQICSRTSQPSE